MPGSDGSSENAVEHGGKIVEDLLIANSDDAVAELRNVLITEFVLISLVLVDAPIDLNHELAGRTVKIEDEPANRVLPPEPEAR